MRVVLFDLDCIRDDHLGCYGYHRDTSPNIDSVAADASRFTSCYTSNAPCVPARAALFSGRFGINTGVATNSGRALRFPPRSGPRHRDRCPMWMRHLTANGMRPVSFSNFADRHGVWWFHEGWKEFHLVNLRRGFETADEVNAVALPWFHDHGGEDNYFAHVHYWDIHQPYRLPDMPKHLERFRGEPLPEWPDAGAIARHYETSHGPRTAHELWPGSTPWSERYPWMPDKVENLDEFRAIIDGYDASIRYVDEHVGQILGALADHGVLDDTVIIITGDHGDCFGECGGHHTDHWIGAEPLLRRPLIIKWPGAGRAPASGTCDEMVYLLDLAPTVCEMLGLPLPDLWDGRSFAPALKGEPFSGYDHVVCENGLGAMQRIVRSREWAYVRTYNPGQHTVPAP
ncbi:MAG: sulfatase [Planctomycetota bacterium]|jgi:arylsulfatase A-like enzyme